MDENLHSIDDLFKKAINEHDESPSGEVWENIDRHLDKKKVVFISKKYNKLKWVAAALLLFSVSMAMYTLHTKMKNSETARQNTGENRKQAAKFKVFKNIGKDISKAKIVRVERKLKQKDSVTKRNDTYGNDENVVNNNKLKQTKNNKDFANKSSVGLATTAKKLGKTQNTNQLETKNHAAKIDLTNIITKETNVVKTEKGIKKFRIGKQELSSGNSAGFLLKKDVAAGVEHQKQNFAIETTNSALQRVLSSSQNGNNQIKLSPAKSVSALKPTQKGFRKTFSATAFYSPDFVSKKVDNDRHIFGEDDRNEIKKREEIKNAYSAGILISYNFSKSWSIESGVTFSALTTDIKPKLIFARPDNDGNISYRFNCSAGYSYITLHANASPVAGDSVRAMASKNILHYIGVPLTLKYNLHAGKLNLNPGVGLAVNFLTKGKIETTINGANGNEKAVINHIEGLSAAYINSAISLGMNYGISKNMAVSFTSAARFAITSINKGAPVKTHLNSVGLAAGLTIRL